MIINSFNFFLNNILHIPLNTERVIFDLTTGSSTLTGEGYTGTVLGASNSTGNAYSGIFDGQSSIGIDYHPNLDFPSWLMFFVFEKTGHQNSTLFSNYLGDNVKSGFTVGVNAANKIYLETYNNLVGPEIFEADINLGSKNAIAIGKNPNSLSINYYNFNTKAIETEFFNINNQIFLRSDAWYIGGAPSYPSYYEGNNFQGYIDNFLYLTGNFFPYEIDILFSGFTLNKTPEYQSVVTNEFCLYDYANLSGEFSNLTFNPIDTVDYYVQTGLLAGHTGELLALTTGIITGGSGVASGRITGFYESGSGFVTTSGTPFSGFQDELIVSGIRVFQTYLPTGTSGAFISFQNNFVSSPVICTDFYSATGVLSHEISGVTTSGFYTRFPSNINGGSGILTTMAAHSQDNTGFKLEKVNISQNLFSQYIEFPTIFSGVPNIFTRLENNNRTPVLECYTSEVSRTGFRANFSDLTASNYILNYCATDLEATGFRTERLSLASGSSSFSNSFSPAFPSNPLVLTQVRNDGGGSMAIQPHNSIVSTTQLQTRFGQNLDHNYKLDTIEWSGVQNMIAVTPTFVSGQIYLGQLTDEVENIFNISGFGTSMVDLIQDLPIIKNVYITGINITSTTGVSGFRVDVDIPVDYTIPLDSGHTGSFVHSIQYSNNASPIIIANHIVRYQSDFIQPDPFFIYKNCSDILGTRLEDYVYNTGYIYSFGMDGVSYLSNANSDDFSELRIFPYSHNKKDVNKQGGVDRTRDYFLFNAFYGYATTELYQNGVALWESGVDVSPTTHAITLEGDYGLTGTYAIVGNDIVGTDDFRYDLTVGNREYRLLPQDLFSGSGLFVDIFNKDSFLNGVKLISGDDFSGNGVNEVIWVSPFVASISGDFFALPKSQDFFLEYSTGFNSILTPRFARGTSNLWTNGIRQELNEDYIEISKYSLLTGNRTVTDSLPIIFNNDGNFWD